MYTGFFFPLLVLVRSTRTACVPMSTSHRQIWFSRLQITIFKSYTYLLSQYKKFVEKEKEIIIVVHICDSIWTKGNRLVPKFCKFFKNLKKNAAFTNE